MPGIKPVAQEIRNLERKPDNIKAYEEYLLAGDDEAAC